MEIWFRREFVYSVGMKWKKTNGIQTAVSVILFGQRKCFQKIHAMARTKVPKRKMSIPTDQKQIKKYFKRIVADRALENQADNQENNVVGGAPNVSPVLVTSRTNEIPAQCANAGPSGTFDNTNCSCKSEVNGHYSD